MAYKTDVIALKKKMVDRNIITLTDLSKTSGVDRNTLSRVFSGKAQPSAAVMHKLVSALQIPAEEAGKIFFSSDLRIA